MHDTPAYGLWSLVIVNSALFIFFAELLQTEFWNRHAWALFVVRDGRARLTPVAIGRTDRARTAIE